MKTVTDNHIRGAQTLLDLAARRDRILTEAGLSLMEARDKNMEVLLETSRYLRLAGEGKDLACIEVAERVCAAERERVEIMARVYTLAARLSGAKA